MCDFVTCVDLYNNSTTWLPVDNVLYYDEIISSLPEYRLLVTGPLHTEKSEHMSASWSTKLDELTIVTGKRSTLHAIVLFVIDPQSNRSLVLLLQNQGVSGSTVQVIRRERINI